MRHSFVLSTVATLGALLAATGAYAGNLEILLKEKLTAQVSEGLDRRIYDKAEIRSLRIGTSPKLNEMSATRTLEHEMPMDYRDLKFRVALSGKDNRKATYDMRCTLGMSQVMAGVRNLNIMWCESTDASNGEPAKDYQLAHFWSQDRVTFQERNVGSGKTALGSIATATEDAAVQAPSRAPLSERQGEGPRFAKDIN
jgi:hypothetical protein